MIHAHNPPQHTCVVIYLHNIRCYSHVMSTWDKGSNWFRVLFWRRDKHMARQYGLYATQTLEGMNLTIRCRLGLVNTTCIIPIFWNRQIPKACFGISAEIHSWISLCLTHRDEWLQFVIVLCFRNRYNACNSTNFQIFLEWSKTSLWVGKCKSECRQIYWYEGVYGTNMTEDCISFFVWILHYLIIINIIQTYPWALYV